MQILLKQFSTFLLELKNYVIFIVKKSQLCNLNFNQKNFKITIDFNF